MKGFERGLCSESSRELITRSSSIGRYEDTKCGRLLLVPILKRAFLDDRGDEGVFVGTVGEMGG